MLEDQIGIGVNAIVIKDNKILLGKRLSKVGYGKWGVPGGKLKYGELLDVAAKRELLEETGLVAEKMEFLQLINDPRFDCHYIHINFLITQWSGNVELKEPDKFEKWDWFDIDNLPENIFEGHAEFVPAYKQRKNIIV